ncbi:MAG: NAD(P)H dehydrogenase (quinone) [Oceanicoccus sp.]|jgi:NAD(P)H dehydrogenase (quinone)
MKIAISAASGRLGHAILSELVATAGPENVVAIVRDPTKLRIANIETRCADYQSPAQLAEALQGLDTLIMISAPVASGGDRLQMHKNVIAAAVNAKVRKLIYTSVISNGLESGTLYADFANINAQTETCIKDSGLQWVIARNGLYLDLDVAQIRAAAESGKYQNSGHEGRCGYMSILEAAHAYAALALNDNCSQQVLNIIGPCYKQSELVEAVNRTFGMQIQYQPISFEANLQRLRGIPFIANRGEDLINMLAGCFQCIENNVFDVASDYLAATGREPISLDEQMQRLL